MPGNLFCQSNCWSREENIYIFLKKTLVGIVVRYNNFKRVEDEMDEYDELFDIQDDFDEQFADELEVLAEMEGEETCCRTS